jgi:hypothetical protein
VHVYNVVFSKKVEQKKKTTTKGTEKMVGGDGEVHVQVEGFLSRSRSKQYSRVQYSAVYVEACKKNNNNRMIR